MNIYNVDSINEYQREALRTASDIENRVRLLHEGVMGLCGESGECIDVVKKSAFQGHELDVDHLVEELGDVAWYLAITAYAIDYDLSAVLTRNLQKLRNRYPDGFDAKKSINRKDGAKNAAN